jgi:hypothetical protein
MHSMTTKTCTACKTEKPLTEFHRFGKNGGQVGKWCEPCFQKKKRPAGQRKERFGNPTQ